MDLIWPMRPIASGHLCSVSLLEAFRANEGDRSARYQHRRPLDLVWELDYFDKYPSKKANSPLGVHEGLLRYGSSKLLMNAAMYALRRSLAMTSKIDLSILILDPGRMSNSSRLSPNAPVKFRISHSVLCVVWPFAQIFSRNIINKARRPAEAVAKVAFAPLRHERFGEERYFVLDEACPVKDMVNDHEFMEMFLRQTIIDVGLLVPAHRLP